MAGSSRRHLGEQPRRSVHRANRRRLGAIYIAAIETVVLFSVAYFASPYWAVHQMQSAAQAGEGDQLSQYVDFPAVRESFKSQFIAMMDQSMTKPGLEDNPFAAFGQMLATAKVGPIVDAMITPDAIAMMIKRGKPPSPPAQAASNPGAPIQTTASAATVKPPRISERYEGWDVFKIDIRDPDTDEEAVMFVLNRNGWFGWKLTAVRFSDLGSRNSGVRPIMPISSSAARRETLPSPSSSCRSSGRSTLRPWRASQSRLRSSRDSAGQTIGGVALLGFIR
jgi:hypothetical protein